MKEKNNCKHCNIEITGPCVVTSRMEGLEYICWACEHRKVDLSKEFSNISRKINKLGKK